MALHEAFPFFFDSSGIPDAIYGRVPLSDFEFDLVNTPEFQRLFRISQLGFGDFVYPTANHKRGTHSLGTCLRAKELTAAINRNHQQRRLKKTAQQIQQFPHISISSRLLISAAALLHDLPHGPLSHDIEKKTHILLSAEWTDSRDSPERIRSHCGPYPKHDDLSNNAALFLMLFDRENSVLANVLANYSKPFWELLEKESAFVDSQWELRADFVEAVRTAQWSEREETLLPQLLFHVLVAPGQTDARGTLLLMQSWGRSAHATPWGLGPREGDFPLAAALHEAWYQPYRHDIVGDTLSADLLDYLRRDTSGLGIPYNVDERFLDNLVLVQRRDTGKYTCALDLMDGKRNTVRVEVVKEIFDLLDTRLAINQKATFHRVSQAAIAMLSRALRLGPKPKPNELYAWDQEGETEDEVARVVAGKSPRPRSLERALCGDEFFMGKLVHGVRTADSATSLPLKLAERRLYKPLLILTGDDVLTLLHEKGRDDDRDKEERLRAFAALIDSTFFCSFFREIERYVEGLLAHALSLDEVVRLAVGRATAKSWRDDVPGRRVILWTLPFKQLYKDPEIKLWLAEGDPESMDRMATDTKTRADLRLLLRAGIANADANYRAMWQVTTFASDGLFYPSVLARGDAGVCRGAKDHTEHLKEAARVMATGLTVAWNYWSGGALKLSRERWLDEGASGEHPLDAEPSNSDWQRILEDFGHQLARNKNDRAMLFVTFKTKFDSLAHEPARDGVLNVPGECRDVRNKFSADFVLGRPPAGFFDLEPRDRAKAFRQYFVAVVSALPTDQGMSVAEAWDLRERFVEVWDNDQESIDSVLKSSEWRGSETSAALRPNPSKLSRLIYRRSIGIPEKLA